MERLSSCYFCGDAVDASLETYPLVPDEHHSSVETDQEVVLCPRCRRKLTTVIEHVLEAAFEGSTDEPIEESADILTDVDADDPMIPTDVQHIDSNDMSETTAASEAGRTDQANTNGSDDPTAGGGDDPWVTAGESDETPSGEADDGGSQNDTDESGESDSAAAATNGSGEPDSDTAETSESRSDGEYSRTEYNKIVKLLQNREFPVEIDEIQVIARNAYGIDEATCQAVLKALIERGVIADRGEELVRT